MKRLNLIAIVILSLFIFSPAVFGQKKLPSGLYELGNSGDYTLKLDGKIYHTNGKLITSLKNIKILDITQNRFRKDIYDLNLQFNNEAVQKLKDGPDYFNRPNYMGIVVKGELIIAPSWLVPITSNKSAISDKSKAKLEQIARQLKAGQL